MESLIPLINELQNVFKTTGTDAIQLPQIVVVGSQSCGKSSVLESLVGKSFLPRGSGIVTRCPIILQLVHLEEIGEPSDELVEWCSFPSSNDPDTKLNDFEVVREAIEAKFGNPDTRYSNFEEVREEIEKRTNEMAGSNKGISMKPIIVKVCSPNIINLTVVDLPGVVKNPVGDQPLDIEEQVHELIKKYIKNPNAIILAVSPANADIATSESIKIAKEVDPAGDRTLAVITKLDLMDKGTDASKVLSGEVIHVKLGIIGVVNRSQFDIDNDKTIENALEEEDKFLRENYSKNIGEIGSPYLAKRLQELLMKHIQNSLPDLIKRIGVLTEEYEAKQLKLGPKIADKSVDKIYAMMEIVNEFHQAYNSAITDRSSVNSEDDVLFPVQITAVFDKFSSILRRKCLIPLLDDKIQSAIRNSVNIERFTSIEDVFKSLAKQHILLMEKPFIDCADEVHEILFRAVEHCLKDNRLEILNAEIYRVTRKLLNSQLKKAKKSIREYMKVQTGIIFSSDYAFLKLLKVDPSKEEGEYDDVHEVGKVVVSLVKPKPQVSFPVTTSIDDRNNNQCQYVKNLITSYFNVIRRQIADYMPKHIMYHLFDCTLDTLKSSIKEAIAGKEMKLVSEPPTVILRRQKTENMLENLRHATEILGGLQSRV